MELRLASRLDEEVSERNGSGKEAAGFIRQFYVQSQSPVTVRAVPDRDRTGNGLSVPSDIRSQKSGARAEDQPDASGDPRRQVVPGDVLRMECTVLRARMGMYRVAGRTFVGGDLACEAEMMFGRGR